MTPTSLIVFGLLCALTSKVCIIAEKLGVESQRSEIIVFSLVGSALILGGIFWWYLPAIGLLH